VYPNCGSSESGAVPSTRVMVPPFLAGVVDAAADDEEELELLPPPPPHGRFSSWTLLPRRIGRSQRA
jgi:hypothetical protein